MQESKQPDVNADSAIARIDDDSVLQHARRWAYRRKTPESWSDLAAVYATRTSPNLARARKWYSRAARKGEPTALFEYGLLLIDGEGGPKNAARGRRLVERAAASGNINALRALAAAYDEGLLTFKRSTSRAERVKRALAKQEAAYRQSLEKSDDPMKLGVKGEY